MNEQSKPRFNLGDFVFNQDSTAYNKRRVYTIKLTNSGYQYGLSHEPLEDIYLTSRLNYVHESYLYTEEEFKDYQLTKLDNKINELKKQLKELENERDGLCCHQKN